MAGPMTLSSFTPEQKQLLRQQMRARHIPVLQIPIERQPRDGGAYPLSYSQERLWLTDQLETDTSNYHLYQAIRITGRVDAQLLEQSLRMLAEKHESLRTAFELEEEHPVQSILPGTDLRLQHIALAGETEAERMREFTESAAELLSEPFQLSCPPLLRTALYGLGAEEHILLFVIHHIISDGWSLRLITEELIHMYNALLSGEAQNTAPLPRDYADYACWQREWFQEDLLEEEIAYWKHKLAAANPFFTFPPDRSRPAVQTFRGDRVGIRLERDHLEALRALARANGVTLFMTLLAAYKVLLFRYTGNGDIVVGTPTAGRSRIETERMVGCFVNNLVLRTEITGASGFAEVLRQTSQTVLEAMQYQNVPFEKVIEALSPERNLGYSPLFQLFFIFQQSGSSLAELDGAVCRPLDYTHRTSKFDMTLEVLEHEDDLDITLEYNTDLYDKETAAGILSHYARLLDNLPRHLDTPVSRIDFLSPAERSRLLNGQNAAPEDYPREASLHRLVERQALDTPLAPALVCEDLTYTYAELMEQAQRLAAYLQETGAVGPARRIGICAGPSLALAAGILAILKTGCVYIPLDPAFPAKRLEYIAGHAELDAVLVGDTADSSKFGGVRCIDIGAAAPCWRHDAAAFTEPESGDADLAYLIYTSGSTGTPKGVRITHQNVVHFLFAMHRLLQMKPEDSLLSVTTCSFDIFVLELFLPLLSGARVIFPAQGTSGDGRLLKEAVEHHAPTFMQATPVMWRMLLAEKWSGSEAMTLLCGGEELRADLAAELKRRGRAVWNLYGPTETTVWSLAHQLGEVDLCRAVPIGRPIGGTTCFILDGELAPVPPGAEGNLYIGGDGVSPGYHRQDGLTAEKFIRSPFDPAGRERLFDTGDRARLLPDGTMVYAGRRDQQIKVRGFRIEPSEIERRLNDQPGIAASVVVAAEDGSSERSLVAYWVPSDTPAEDGVEAKWRALLREELPAYMIPSRFIPLDSLPLTPNKKVDRKHLALLPLDRQVHSRTYTSPRSDLERKLVQIWERILGRQPIGIHDHFFDLGGHSLLAVQLIAAVNGEFKTGLTLRQLFLSPTVAGLAAAMEAEGEEPAVPGRIAPALPSFVSAPADAYEPFPLTEVQMAYWTGRQANLAVPNVSTHVYQEMEIASLDVDRFERSLRVLIRRHPMLRAFITADGVQQVLPEVPDYQIKRLNARTFAEDGCQAALDGVRKAMSHQVHSGSWPLFAVQATLLPQDRTRLHISFDLMIADARSFQIILTELARLYAQSGELPVLEATFRDYVLSLLSLTAADVYDSSKAYWMERIPTLPAGPELPLSPASLKLEKLEFKRWKAVLDARLWSRLGEKARAQGITKSVLLLTCFSEVLALYSKQPHFLLNLTLFNRLPLHPQLDEVVGDFTTVSLLEVDFSARAPFAARALAVQDRLWNDLDHRYFSGIRVTEQLLKHGILNEPVPVVFTSLLDMPKGGGLAFEEAFRLANEEATEARSISQTPQVWLDHQVAERGGELHFNWDVVEELFPAGMVGDMFAAYCGLLHSLAGEPEIWERALPLSGPEMAGLPHRVKLAGTAKRHHRPLDTDGDMLHGGFQQMVRQQPEAAAVAAPDRTLSYAELNREANAVARQLLSLPDGPGELVAVVMDKGWEQVAAVLGILKAKAAYLPVDAALPAERIRELLRLGQVKAAVVQPSASREAWPEEVVRIVAGAEDGMAEPGEYGTDDSSDAGRLAYVIFTSGSTGVPKGVMISHGSAMNTIADINQRFGVSAADVVFGLSSLSFDLSVYDIFGTLAAGGTLVLPHPDRMRDPSHWLELVGEHGVTIWNSVPALMNMLTAYAGPEAASAATLRLALLSGDWIPLGLPDEIRRLNANIAVVALGGATEASIWSIMYPVREVDPVWKSIPYGLSLGNQRVYVLNGLMEECPHRVPGELYIGGAGIALGYWMDERRTGDRFLTHPETKERLYRTGDTGCYREDGTIEFLGRVDSQVKMGGYRIELGEIESVLKKHPGIRDAAVIADGEGDAKRLYAFAVANARQNTALDGPAIRSYLKDRLPGYMIPGSIAVLESIPLTGNGKINRAVLLAERTAAEPAAGAAPQSGLEGDIAGLWKKLLNRQEIGTDEHFFDIGGNSLKLVQMQKELQQLLGREVPIVDLFKYTTISLLAAHIGGDCAEEMPAGQEASTRAELRLSSRRTRRR